MAIIKRPSGILVSLVLIVFSILPLKGQQANTMFFMKGIPQVYQVNPALQPACNFFLGLPAVSPLQVKVSNNSFGFSDAFSYNSSIDSIISFLHPLADKESFLTLLRDRNFLQTEFSTNFASIGIGTDIGTYFTFDIRERIEARIGYPDDLIRLPIFGPDSGLFYDFNGLSIDALVFNEFSMGISQKIGNRLTLGWRGKLLFGQANLQTQRVDLTVATGEDVWPIHSDILMNATIPFVDVVYDEEGMIDFENSIIREDLSRSIPSMIFNPLNFGLAMDIGFDLQLTKWLELSGSIVDLGKIKWTDYVYNISSSNDFDFEGVEFNIKDEDFAQTFLDSTLEDFKFTASENPYTTWLPTKLYLGAAFYPHPKISFGVLSRTEFYEKRLRQQFTGSANFYPIRMLSASFSYSVIEGTYKNLGFGLGLKAGPFNLYMISDTAPSAAFWPLDARYLNFKLGMNLVFGCRKIVKEKVYDKPLID